MGTSFSPGCRKVRGAFETVRVERGVLRSWPAHYRRLRRGLALLNLRLPWTRRTLARLVGERVRAAGGDARAPVWRARVMVWEEQGRRQESVVVAPCRPLSGGCYRRGVAVLLLSSRRRFSFLDGLFKSLDYGVYRRATQRAVSRGCFDGLLVAPDGRVVDGGRSSVFLLMADGVLAPSPGGGTLDSVTLDRLCALARKAGLPVCRRPVYVDDLAAARGLWLVNALAGAVPVRVLRGMARPPGKGRGPAGRPR